MSCLLYTRDPQSDKMIVELLSGFAANSKIKNIESDFHPFVLNIDTNAVIHF